MSDHPAIGLLSDQPAMGKLTLFVKFGYGLGHIFNDLCSSMWFSYLLIYFHMVLQFDNRLAGTVLLVGQIADGLATPFVGLEIDGGHCFARYGKRKAWHAVGTLCVISSFSFIFLPCWGCEHSHQWAQLIYYCMFVIIFQFGWATVQISHLSLVPHLTQDPDERTELIAWRYGSTVLSNIAVYVTAWIVLGIQQSPTNSNIDPSDQLKFTEIVIVVMGLGLLSSLFFHLLVPESNSNDDLDQLIPNAEDNTADLLPAVKNNDLNKHKWTSWFKQAKFYQVAVLYMGTRLYVNLSQVYLPLFLQDTLLLPEVSIAILPLVMFCAGFVTSFPMKALNRCLGRKITYFLGLLMCFGGCISIWFGSGIIYAKYGIYGSVVLMGAGASTILVTSLGITADMIGSHSEGGAFVYGAMSLTDKLSNGIVVMIIQSLHPCVSSACCTACSPYYRLILSAICGGAGVLCLIALITLVPVSLIEDGGQPTPLDSSKEEDKISPYTSAEINNSANNDNVVRIRSPRVMVM